MNQNLNPITAFIIVLVSLCMIGMIFWARGESLGVGGPDQIQKDHKGNAYIHVANKLYKLSPDMVLLDVYDLSEMGVYDLVGDFAFFSNGDMLVRLGKYDPGLLESIRRYRRIADTKPPVAEHENEGLYRCKLTVKECLPFGPDSIDFDSAFHLSIDSRTDIVYVSDTGRHKLRKYDADGNELAIQNKGYKFPNQITLQGDRLLVADTNHHAVQVAEISDDKFGQIVDTHSTRSETSGRDIWTYSFAKVGDKWWVNNMTAAMSSGSVSIYDNSWQFLKTIDLPADADPIDFAVLDHRVLISDLNNIRIYQLDYQGNQIEDVLPGDITVKLTQLQQSRTQYMSLTYMAIGGFVLLLMGGFIVAIRQAREAQDPDVVIRSQKIYITIDNPNINWIPVNKQKMRLLKYGTWLPISLLLIIPYMFYSTDKQLEILPIVFILFIVILVTLLLFRLSAMGIGSLDGMLVIKKSDKDFAAAQGSTIIYSDTHILIDDVYIPFNRQQLFFETEPVIKEIMPLLRDATYVKGGQMTNMILKRQKLWHIVVTFASVVVFVAILLSYIYRQ